MQRELLGIEQKHYLETIKDVNPEVLEKIQEEFKVKYAHDAIHIEGKSVITLKEAFTLDKVCEKKKVSEREQKELLNHIKAFKHVCLAIEKDINFDEEFIKDTHQLLLEDIMPGGLYRQVNVGLKGYHQPPDYLKIYDRMRKMIDELEFSFRGTAIEKSAFVALTISKIHPFIDGNGRVSRLMMNYFLMKNNYLPISINHTYKDEYFKALDEFKIEKKMDMMVKLIEKLLLERYSEVNQQLSQL